MAQPLWKRFIVISLKPKLATAIPPNNCTAGLYREIRLRFTKSVSCSIVSDSWTPWTIAQKDPLSMEFSRQEYWNGQSFLSSGDLPDPGIEPGSPALQEDSLPSELPVKPKFTKILYTNVHSSFIHNSPKLEINYFQTGINYKNSGSRARLPEF